MTDLDKTQECPVYTPEHPEIQDNEITLRERFILINNLDGSTKHVRIESPWVPKVEEIIEQYYNLYQQAPEGNSIELKYNLPQAFDAFLYQLFENYAPEYKQKLYQGLAEQGIKICVEVNPYAENENRIINYRLICDRPSGPLIVTPPTAKWSAFLDKTEDQIKKLCQIHIQRKKTQLDRRLAARVGPGNRTSTSVSQTLVSARLSGE